MPSGSEEEGVARRSRTRPSKVSSPKSAGSGGRSMSCRSCHDRCNGASCQWCGARAVLLARATLPSKRPPHTWQQRRGWSCSQYWHRWLGGRAWRGPSCSVRSMPAAASHRRAGHVMQLWRVGLPQTEQGLVPWSEGHEEPEPGCGASAGADPSHRPAPWSRAIARAEQGGGPRSTKVHLALRKRRRVQQCGRRAESTAHARGGSLAPPE